MKIHIVNKFKCKTEEDFKESITKKMDRLINLVVALESSENEKFSKKEDNECQV